MYVSITTLAGNRDIDMSMGCQYTSALYQPRTICLSMTVKVQIYNSCAINLVFISCLICLKHRKNIANYVHFSYHVISYSKYDYAYRFCYVRK